MRLFALLVSLALFAPPASSPDRLASIPADAVRCTPADDPYPPILHVPGYQQPVPVPGALGTAGAEDSPFITADGKRMLFFFTPDVRVPPERQILDGVTGIYQATLGRSGWTNVRRVQLAPPGQLALDGAPCVIGNTLWFCTARVGNHRGVDMWTATRRGDGWADFRNAGERLNRDLQIGEVHAVGPDELYFHSGRAGGRGGLDIWRTVRKDGVWQDPTNIAAVNSTANEGWPFVSADGKELWFTRTYRGTPAIYRSRRQGTEWTAPEIVVSQFAGEPTLDRPGNLYFVHHFYRDGRMIEADIYVARRR